MMTNLDQSSLLRIRTTNLKFLLYELNLNKGEYFKHSFIVVPIIKCQI